MFGAMKKRKASSTKCSKSCQKLKFVAFCAARQAVLLNRRDGLPRAEWTNDRILARARFCNIDRRDDAVTAELVRQFSRSLVPSGNFLSSDFLLLLLPLASSFTRMTIKKK